MPLTMSVTVCLYYDVAVTLVDTEMYLRVDRHSVI
jgi:hypothetical protein